MTKETIKRKIELLEEELAMQIEGSVMYDSIHMEIAYLKAQLSSLREKNNECKQN